MHEFESGFFVHQPAWHGLGKLIENVETTQEGLVLAGCDWLVKLESIFLESGPEVEEYQAVVRESDRSILGIVGNRFVPLQNIDAFSFFDPLLESGDFVLDAAGSLQNGRKIWVLVRESEGSDFEVGNGDNVRRYLLLTHGHDGTLAVRIGWTTVRVVCMNTLQGALRSSESKLLKVKHTRGMHDALNAIQGIIQKGHEKFQATLEQYRVLMNTPCDMETLRRYVRVVIAGKEHENNETKS